MDSEYEKSGITTEKDIKRRPSSPDPSTVTVIGSENIGGGVETGSTGERDMHSDATSVKHNNSAPPRASGDVTTEEDSSSSSCSRPGESHQRLRRIESDDVHDGCGAVPASSSTRLASDYQRSEELSFDTADRIGIHKPFSSGNRATDATGVLNLQ